MANSALLYAHIFLPLLLGVSIYAFDRKWVNRLVFPLQFLLSLTFLFGLCPLVLAPGGLEQLSLVAGGWSTLVGVGLKVNGLSLTFLAMTLLAFWYIWLYIWPDRGADHKFLFFLCTLQTALSALFVVNDLFAVFVLIELITILGSILITYKKDALAVRAGLFYLLYNSWGMLLYLFGAICLYWQTGSLNIDLVAPHLADWASSPVLSFGIACIVAGLGIKSAFFMLHLWLPMAHSAAPAAISAILSGLIVKMGIFVLLRIDGLVAIAEVQALLVAVGLISGLSGAVFAMFQSDMKRILAFHTISQLGLVFVGVGLYGEKNSLGALAHLFNHFTFKSLLFLAVGLIILETGERRTKYIRGLFRWHPKLAVCLAIGIVSIMGFPLTSASLSKVLIKSSPHSGWITLGLYAINLGTLVSFVKLGTVLTGEPSETLKKSVRRHDRSLWALYFIAFITLLALPLEWFLSLRYAPALTEYYLKQLPGDAALFFGLLAAATLFYHKALKPMLKRFPHLGHKDFSFAQAMTGSLVFLWLTLEYFAR